MKQILSFVTVTLFYNITSRAQEMPIIGYMGVPQTETSVERYREMQECGFNTNLTIFDGEKQVLEALEVADSLGMKLIPFSNAFFLHPETSVPHTDGYASLMAYLVFDEPYMKDFPTVLERMEGIQNAGATKPCYINLHPYYNLSLYTQMGLSSYDEYLKESVSALDMPFISFDHYPILNGDSIRTTWYDNLKMIRNQSHKTGKPFWAFVLSTPHLVYSEPTLEQLRLQVNVNLAYGAQAIQYYTYWHPKSDDADYHDSPIESNGKKTATYDKVKQVNEELRKVAPLFYEGKITKVKHVSDKFMNVTIKADSGAVGSLLTTHDGKRYLVLVNKSLKQNMSVMYHNNSCNVEPGGMLMLQR